LKAIESKRRPVSGRALVQGFDLGASAGVVAQSLNSLENMMFAKRLLAKDALLWSRSPDDALRISGLLGWLSLPYSMSGRVSGIASFANELRQDGYKNAILLGMGGSSLAPLVLSSAFGQIKGFPRLIVLDSTDPQAVLKAGGMASKDKTVFIVSSKSGTTIEPMTLLERFYRLVYGKKGVNAGRDFVAITDPGTYLEGLAKKSGFRRVFINTPDVGGRFSALSYFGLVPAAIVGIDVSRLLYNAQRMLELMHPARPYEENPALMLGACLGAFCKEGRDKLTFFAPKALSMFPLWVEQLVAESTGKDGKGIVPVAGEPVLEAAGYARDRVFVNIEMNRRSSAPQSMVAGLKKLGHPVITIGLNDPYELGAEFMRWEAATAVAGAMLGINPFDQPDVELSKRLAMSRLDDASNAGGVVKPVGAKVEGRGFAVFFSEEAFKPVKKSRAAGKASTALKAFFSLLKKGDYVALLPYLNPFDRPLHRNFTKLRKTLTVATGAATQFGWGPRYLHSTGQLHKGGPDNGVFIIFACAKGPEAAIPERGFDFLSLELSQAFGDMEALNAKGRRAALILLNDRSKTAFDNALRAVEKAAKGRA
ncbi:MAG: transaldolase, partial [Deltaproteobacteria bacterium]|nr:transaldolase [Deltaproteobacteria bacterium]